MNDTIKEVKQTLHKYRQDHLLEFIDRLTNKEIEKLLAQVNSIDFESIRKLYIGAIKANEVEYIQKVRNISPIHSDVLSSFDERIYKKCESTGLDLIKKGKVAAVTMAGGQGTRLGHSGPKGTYDIGLPSGKTLFQLQLDRLTSISSQCGNWIPWYIMTSDENHKDTLKYFESNNYFGYPKTEISFFIQGTLPMVNKDGRILLKDKHEIYFGPNGNGGIFISLKESGKLDDMKKRGIEWVFICGIDNALVKMVDPVFIGCTEMVGKKAVSKSVLKKNPDEKVGVFCLEDGRPSIVEYTELPEEYIRKTNPNGELIYGEANIIAHLFRIDVLCSIAEVGLPYHTAFKKASYIDNTGKKVNTNEPNAYKFESFIFDAFKYVDDMAILRVEREKEFAPVKNRTGDDSPETARNLLLSVHTWDFHY